MAAAHVHETPGAGKLTPFERRRDALVCGAGEDEEDENSGNPDERASHRRKGHYDSGSARPYFSMRE